MFNYTYDKDGVYIANLANKGEKYGLTQYRLPHNYELAKRSFTISDGTEEHVISFEDKRKAFVDGRECEYESLKLQVKTYFVRLGYDAAVFDLQQNLVTLIRGLEKDYFSGRISGAEVQREELPGLGVVARFKDLAVLAGSAEFMKRSGLSVLPFPENAQVLHMGVNGHYVGCIDFSESQQSEDCVKMMDEAGFFRFKDAAEADEKRLPGEKLLYMHPASASLSGQKDDLNAAAGVMDRFDQITVERCGRAGTAALMEQLNHARLGRKGILLVSLIVKAFLLLLTILGICPLWLAVLLELAAAAFSYRYTVHLLDYTPKY